MQKTTLVTALVTAAVFAVAGYFAGSNSQKLLSVKYDHKAKSCKGGDCDIDIKFACVDPANPSPATCEPYADPELVVVDTGKKIKFTIDNSTGYTFDPSDGIKFASAYFPCKSQAGQKKYDCDIAIPSGTPLGFYKYSIHVVGFTTVDPWVVNY